VPRPALFAPVLAALALAACSQPKELTVDGAWVRLGAAPKRPAAAYFTLHGGATDATLIAVSTDVAIKSEMHETVSAPGGVMAMRPIQSVPVPAGSTVAFKPGGRHVMLFDVNPGIKPGGRAVLLSLAFADGRRLQQNATVLGAADAPPP
jgi:periplasmic copper chaperone A